MEWRITGEKTEKTERGALYNFVDLIGISCI